MTSAPSDAKVALRREMLARRRQCHEARGLAAAGVLRDRVMAEVGAESQVIAGYWPLGDEVDCRPALEALAARGARVALPVVAGQGVVLLFRTWQPGAPLEPGPFGTAHPVARAAVVEPETLLLPLVAFDATGHRLGYGAGYYDRTVAALRRERRITAIGLAYDEQEIALVPAAEHDQRLDGVITDRRTLWFKNA